MIWLLAGALGTKDLLVRVVYDQVFVDFGVDRRGVVLLLRVLLLLLLSLDEVRFGNLIGFVLV